MSLRIILLLLGTVICDEIIDEKEAHFTNLMQMHFMQMFFRKDVNVFYLKKLSFIIFYCFFVNLSHPWYPFLIPIICICDIYEYLTSCFVEFGWVLHYEIWCLKFVLHNYLKLTKLWIYGLIVFVIQHLLDVELLADFLDDACIWDIILVTERATVVLSVAAMVEKWIVLLALVMAIVVLVTSFLAVVDTIVYHFYLKWILVG